MKTASKLKQKSNQDQFKTGRAVQSGRVSGDPVKTIPVVINLRHHEVFTRWEWKEFRFLLALEDETISGFTARMLRREFVKLQTKHRTKR